MKRIVFLTVAAVSFYFTQAQDQTVKKLQEDAAATTIKKDEHDTSGKVWKKGGLFALNISQGSLTNWQAGGDDFSMAAVAFLNVFAFYKQGKESWDNNLDLGFGYLNTTSLGNRKSDDKISLTSKYGHQISKKWNLSGLVDLRTQFTKGYHNTKDASGSEVNQLTSDFFSPAYLLMSVGFDFKPNSYFSCFLSPFTERYIFVVNDYLSSIGAYGVPINHSKKNELGAYLSATFNKEILKNVTYKTKFDAFSNYKVKPKNVDIFWNNILAMKINRFLSTNILLDLLYDDDAIARLQVRELLGVGISVKF
jgi:hypothetical protein